MCSSVILDENRVFAANSENSRFGSAIARIGDIDGDGTEDLCVGAGHDDDGGSDRGAVFILFMNTDGSVEREQKISMLEGGLGATLVEGSGFGFGVAGLGDLNYDGVPDMAVTADRDSVRDNRRAVFFMLMNADGTVKAEGKLGAAQVTELVGPLTWTDFFASDVTTMSGGNGMLKMAVGVRGYSGVAILQGTCGGVIICVGGPVYCFLKKHALKKQLV